MYQQDLVWVRLPFSSLEDSKIRPAIVVSNNGYNKRYEDIVVCAITSKLEETPYSIIIDQKNISSGRLPVKSRIRADKIMQIEKSLVVRSFARLDDETFDDLVKLITNLVKRI
ncbi:MAG: type II toxin-antitoxin system PemK/MazF family toxin [Candidatus Aenigmarchaeota archaeon]|nr:type II toxin-antitoxin system PemK/MazF family toxin [Candidatus Aenigmarchaeota archaeon]